MGITCLNEIGINTESAMNRFMGNEALYGKMLTKFLDEPSFSKLCEAVCCKDGSAALAASHTLKGLCGNLSMDVLYNMFSEQVALMRAGEWEKAYGMMPQITEDYQKLTDGIKAWLNK